MIDLLLMAASAASFVYEAKRDLMTDQVTHIATLEIARDQRLVIGCGAETDGDLIVNYRPGRILRDRPSRTFLPWTNRFRFDQNPPVNLSVGYNDNAIVLVEESARSFIAQAKASSVVTIEFRDYTDSVYQHAIQLPGLNDALKAIEKNCPAR